MKCVKFSQLAFFSICYWWSNKGMWITCSVLVEKKEMHTKF